MPAGAAVTGAAVTGADDAGARDAGADADGGADGDGDEAAERAGTGTADGARVVPHAAVSAAMSSPPHAVASDFFFTELAS
jgi:hypothetical protein